MQVIVTKAQLDAHRACGVQLNSPEWDPEQSALVYPDWSQTVTRLLSTRLGTTYLDWLVKHELVPMTKVEFIAARRGVYGV